MKCLLEAIQKPARGQWAIVHRMRFRIAALCLSFFACPQINTNAIDGGDAGGGGPVDAGNPWDAVDALLVTQSAQSQVTDFGLVVFAPDGQVLHEKMFGSFTADKRVAIASASKLVSGMVLFELIKRGQLTLDSTTGTVLSWTGPNKDITLRHLMSFTSGLAPEAACTINNTLTLEDCVNVIAAAPIKAAPGATYEYGSTHLHVAGRMAEVVTGKRWNDLYDEVLRVPLGLPTDTTYFTTPRQPMRVPNNTNPLIAGGMRASINEYAKLLQLAFHKGQHPNFAVGTTALFDEQAHEPFPAATIVKSPFALVGVPFRYGLTAWLECDTPATGCDVLSSPGAFGFTPWYDRRTGYTAILGMELDSVRGGVGNGVVDFSVHLEQDLKSLILRALESRR